MTASLYAESDEAVAEMILSSINFRDLPWPNALRVMTAHVRRIREAAWEDPEPLIRAEPIFSDWTERYWQRHDSMKPMLHITIEDYRARVLTRLNQPEDSAHD